MKRKVSKLALKLTIGFVLLGILICVTSSIIGYNQFKSAIQKQYNDTAYQIAHAALSYVDKADLKTYAKAVTGFHNGTVTQEELDAYMAEEKYQKVSALLTDLRASMDANDVFLVHIEKDVLNAYTPEGFENKTWTPLWYIFDSYAQPEYSFMLGNASIFNPEFIEEVNGILDTGATSSNLFISEGPWGYNTSALLPVTDEQGEVIALACVEIPMKIIQSVLREYIMYAVLVTVVLVILFIAIYMFYLYRKVVSPINKVSTEVGRFIENNNTVSDELNRIKTHDEIQTLAENTLQMQIDINKYIEDITHITAEKERIGAELDVANHIQASMLPRIFPAFPDRTEFDVYATMNPAKEVGGDFYDFFMVDDTHIAIVVADVSGKGVPAALFMVIAKTLIKDHTMPQEDLGKVFSVVNELLCTSNSEGMFVTAFEGVLDLVTGEFRFVNAGHEMPFICKKDQSYAPYKIRPGFVLAGMEGMTYKAGSIELEPGDKIFEYTDGVTEATDKDNQLYGMERLEAILAANSRLSPTDLLPAVKADIDAFVGTAPQFDDITMLCLEYKERGKSAE